MVGFNLVVHQLFIAVSSQGENEKDLLTVP